MLLGGIMKLGKVKYLSAFGLSLVFVLGMLVFVVLNWADKNVFENKGT